MSTAVAPLRQHASTGPSIATPPEPSHAERVRTLLSLSSVATLSTQSRKHAGFPFGSLMPFASDSAGRPIFLISNMAMHTQNLRTEPRCSLFILQTGADGDPLGAARATLVGNAEPVPADEVSAVRDIYLARHENSRYWVDFADFTSSGSRWLMSTTWVGSGLWAGLPPRTTPAPRQTRWQVRLRASSRI